MSSDDKFCEDLLASFDHRRGEFAIEGMPASVYAEARRRCPVLRTNAWGGYWVLSRYQDIVRVARDHSTFSNRLGVNIPGMIPEDAPADILRSIPLWMDPPESMEWRRLLNPLFSPKAVAAQEDSITAIANDLIDQFAGRGHSDLHHDFTLPFASRVICRIVGLPEEEWEDFARPFSALQARQDPDNPVHGIQETDKRKIMERVLAEVEQRRSAPRTDILTALANAEIFERALTPREIGSIAVTLIGGGVDTTSNALGVALVELGRCIEHRRRLLRETEILPLAVEELLRLISPFQALGRTATSDATIGDRRIRSGEKVLMAWASANRDEDEFPRSDELVLDRQPNRHLAFGLGVHHCLGAHLARTEMRIGIQQFLARIPIYEVDENGLHLQPDVGQIYGYETIPVSFRAAGKDTVEPR